MFLRRIGSLAVFFAAVAVSALLDRAVVFADTFGTGANTLQIDFVTIGEPGNPRNREEPAWLGPIGSVPYIYRIGKYEISTEMIHKAIAATAGSANPLRITTDPREPLHPATGVNWFEAAKFVNWLNTSSGHWPAYKFEPVPPDFGGGDRFALWTPSDPGYDPDNPYRNTQAFYFLPSHNEWYKAAYYVPGTGSYNHYPTGDITPIPVAGGTDPDTAVYLLHGPPGDVGPTDIMNAGGLSAFGTMAQGGNVHEWMETAGDTLNSDPLAHRFRRGGSWGSSSSALSWSGVGTLAPSLGGGGVRVASVPEPSAVGVAALALCYCTLWRRPVPRRSNNERSTSDASSQQSLED